MIDTTEPAQALFCGVKYSNAAVYNSSILKDRMKSTYWRRKALRLHTGYVSRMKYKAGCQEEIDSLDGRGVLEPAGQSLCPDPRRWPHATRQGNCLCCVHLDPERQELVGTKGVTLIASRVTVTKLPGGIGFQPPPSRSKGSETRQRPAAARVAPA